MELEELQDRFSVNKVPSHPNESTFDDWLDLYEAYARLSSHIFEEGKRKELLDYMKTSLSEHSFDDKKYYVLKMHLRDIDEVIVRRRSVKNKRKNSFLSRIAKRRWRRNRHKYNRALKKFHRSSKGKEFHKSLGQFLKKSLKKKEGHAEGLEITDKMLVDLMLAINSAMTHFLIEFEHKYKQEDPSSYEYSEDFSVELLELTIELTDQMLLDLAKALEADSHERYNIFHDVIYLAGEVLIPSGIETEYEYDG